nr:DMT family transporter [uncultured Peptostreptococcus sp.]
MNKKLKVNLLGLATISFWALAFPFSKVAMQHFTPYSLGFLRVCIASIVLLIIGIFTKIRMPKVKDIGWLLLSAACGFGVYLFVFNKGIQTITSASSSIIIALTPILTAIESSKIYGEKINKIGWVSMITAFGGVLIMMLWDGVLSVNTGMIWTLCASVLFSIYNNLNRKLSMDGYRGIEIVTYSMVFSILILSPFSMQGKAELMAASGKYILVLLVLSVFSSAIAYFLWSIALSIADKTSEVANFSFLTPFFATLLGSLVLGEVPNMGTVIGGIIIISSMVVFSKRNTLYRAKK